MHHDFSVCFICGFPATTTTMPSVTGSARYELLPTSDTAKAQEELSSNIRKTHLKQILFRVLALAAIMFVAIQGIRSWAKSSARFSHKPCHGLHRNLSSLPSHYTLPSGDRIPSVALGMFVVWFLAIKWRVDANRNGNRCMESSPR